MLTKKTFGIIVYSVMSISVFTWFCNYALSEEEKTFKHSVKPLAPKEKIPEVKEVLICPLCKKQPLGHMKGKTHAPIGMVCPDCKNEISELDIHHCDKCDKDVLVCAICKRESARLAPTTQEAKCPNCKMVRTRPIKGQTISKWKMKCPDCKKETKVWNLQHCDECDTNFLACPLCEKEKK